MTVEEIIMYVNSRLNCTISREFSGETRGEGLSLSPEGEKFIRERYNKSEDQGGYSSGWKEKKYEDIGKYHG